MKGFFTIAIITLVYFPAFAQWNETFDDGEFTSNPMWVGDTGDFSVEAGQLRLTAPAQTAASYLSTASDISLEAVWGFSITFDFNPSSSNYAKVYLMADSLNLNNTQNGYFVKIGGTADEISLYKVIDGLELKIIDGLDDRVDLSKVEINLQVTRAPNGDWELSSKLTGEPNFVSEAPANDLSIQKSTYFGVFCKYTSTRSTKFYVDNIAVTGSPYVDSDPPLLVANFTPDSKQIGLVFNEGIDTLEAKNLTHYALNDSLIPAAINVLSTDSLVLSFSNDLSLINSLQIKNLPDLTGNTLDTLIEVIFVDTSPMTYRNLVINEIFPDPNPPEDLPGSEFIELFNNSTRIIDIDGWQFTDGSKVAVLESTLIYPDSFLIICEADAQTDYELFGRTMGLSNWPALNNGGDSLKLLDSTGKIIDSLAYSISWYKDDSKDNGGWSLEQINPNGICIDSCNWEASIAPGGGTPGSINSVFDLGLDEEAPVLIASSTPSVSQIKLVFNEPLDSLDSKDKGHYILNESIAPSAVSLFGTDTVVLEFISNIELMNTLNIVGLTDIAGNKLDTLVVVYFVDPAPHAYRDIVINEIFADPNPQEDLPPFEFIELYNNSDRIIDLAGWAFSDDNKTSPLSPVLLFPDSFLIICPFDGQELYLTYGNTTGLTSWPSLNNGGDRLLIKDKNGQPIDSVLYTMEWYKNSAKDDGGWSLEQINPHSNCGGIFNWATSNSPSGGTPGSANSLLQTNIDLTPPIITQALLSDTLVEVWVSKPLRTGTFMGIINANELNVPFTVNQPSLYVSGIINKHLPQANYVLKISLEDCEGNNGTAEAMLLTIATPRNQDIIINELLFNPYQGGSDFVEIYNNSENYFNLKNYQLSNESNSTIITDTTLLLRPQHYLALSEDILFLKNEYLAPDSSLFETDLPTMPNDEGLIVLKSASDVIIDSVVYNEDFHFSLINEVEGISLERISTSESSTLSDNWRSASETTNYATPGYENSQSQTPSNEGSVTVQPQIITPNNDGQSDFCQIGYSLESQSQTISITIYNLQGQLIKTITNNSIISPSGFFTWDGTDQQGGNLPTAHYIIVSEIITSDGRVLTFRNKVVVANGF